MLGVTLVGDFSIFLRPKVLKNSRYFQMIFYLRLLLCSYFLPIILNHSDISLYSESLVYTILHLTY